MFKQNNLLIVGDFNRRDFVDLFLQCRDDFDMYFLEYASEEEVKSDYYKKFGQGIFWKDFSDAYDLLNRINPSKVVFFFIESYNHIALNAACKVKGVKTFHLEHGYRDYNFTKFIVKQIRKPKAETSVTGKESRKLSLKHLYIKLKTQLFFFRTVVKSPLFIAKFLMYYYKVRRSHIIFDTFKIVNSPLRLADAYISFSPGIFEAHKKFDHLDEDQEVFFIGFPNLGRFSDIRNGNGPISKKVIFIDQPFVKQGLLGWNKEFQKKFISLIVKHCQDNGYRLYVKKHPLDGINFWNAYEELKQVSLINEESQLVDLLTDPCVVLGFYSTLLLPLAALPNTTLITVENHPVKDIFTSEFLVRSGVSEPVFNMEELSYVLQSVEIFREKQQKHKQKFVEDWLYKFDSKALHRLKKLLLT